MKAYLDVTNAAITITENDYDEEYEDFQGFRLSCKEPCLGTPSSFNYN
jgi:hypothetical protein